MKIVMLHIFFILSGVVFYISFSNLSESQTLNFPFVFNEDIEDHDETPPDSLFTSDEFDLYLNPIHQQSFFSELDFGFYVIYTATCDYQLKRLITFPHLTSEELCLLYYYDDFFDDSFTFEEIDE